MITVAVTPAATVGSVLVEVDITDIAMVPVAGPAP
jgi:hypothetical protein